MRVRWGGEVVLGFSQEGARRGTRGHRTENAPRAVAMPSSAIAVASSGGHTAPRVPRLGIQGGKNEAAPPLAQSTAQQATAGISGRSQGLSWNGGVVFMRRIRRGGLGKA